MNWKFWKKMETAGNGEKLNRLTKPREIPEAVGRKMIVGMKLDPDAVWALKYVTQPLDNPPKTFAFRLFDPDQAKRSGVAVTDWTALDAHPDLILYKGVYQKETKQVDIER